MTMRTQHVGDAAPTTLDVVLVDDGMTITLTDGSTFPDGTYPFWIAINKGGATEEKVLCSGRTGNVLSVWTDGVNTGRGGDGTSAVAHDINEPVEHVWTAGEADEVNAHANLGSGAHGYPAIEGLVTLDGEETLTNKTLDAPVVNDAVLTGGGGSLDSLQVAAQALDEPRVRNIIFATTVPGNEVGEDGDVCIIIPE